MKIEANKQEMEALLYDWAETVCDNIALRGVLQKWHDLFGPVVQPGTEGASLVEMTRDALASSLRYSSKRHQG